MEKVDKEKAPAYQEYPANKQADENFILMTMDERGLWWTLRHFAWIHKGIPRDMDLIARLVHLPKDVLEKMWERVGLCFEPHPTNDKRLVDIELEEYRLSLEVQREKNSAAGKASADARAAKAEDQIVIEQRFLYNDGSAYLMKATNLSNSASRSLIGKWLKLYARKEVLEVMRLAMETKPMDPVAYMTGALETRTKGRKSKSAASQDAADEALKELNNGNK